LNFQYDFSTLQNNSIVLSNLTFWSHFLTLFIPQAYQTLISLASIVLAYKDESGMSVTLYTFQIRNGLLRKVLGTILVAVEVFKLQLRDAAFNMCLLAFDIRLWVERS
jgi:hypothetical protein